MDVILLERVGKLGHMGDTVKVKDGYARNFLLAARQGAQGDRGQQEEIRGPPRRSRGPQSRTQARRRRGFRKARRGDGGHHSQRGETGQLYGSVSARDIAEALTAAGHPIQRGHVAIQHPIKALGLHPVPIHLHPEVETKVTVNVARSAEQAERQAKGEDLTVREQTSMDDLGARSRQGAGGSRPRREPWAGVRGTAAAAVKAVGKRDCQPPSSSFATRAVEFSASPRPRRARHAPFLAARWNLTPSGNATAAAIFSASSAAAARSRWSLILASKRGSGG